MQASHRTTSLAACSPLKASMCLANLLPQLAACRCPFTGSQLCLLPHPSISRACLQCSSCALPGLRMSLWLPAAQAAGRGHIT